MPSRCGRVSSACAGEELGVRPWEGAGERPSCESGSRDNYFTPQLGYVLLNVTGVAVHRLRPYLIGFIRFTRRLLLKNI